MVSTLVVGCGGGGGGSSTSVSHFGGNYAGPYTVSLHGSQPAGFAPANGNAGATVSNAGALRVDYGNSYVLTGTLHNDGSVTSGSLAYPSSSGTQAVPAVIGWSQSGAETTVVATVQFTSPSGDATFNAALSPLP